MRGDGSGTLLEETPVELEPRVPGGGGPPDLSDPGRGGGGDGDGDGNDDYARKESLYRLGTLLTLLSIAALFIALILVFWFRSRTTFLWQPVEAPHALWISTAILGISSWMLELSRHALADHHWFAYRRRLLLTVYLGLAFFACQAAALYQLVSEGLYLRGNPHASVFYVFTSAHGFHLIFGMGALVYLLFRRGRNWSQHRLLANSIAMYWHFMGGLWLALFVLLLTI